MGVEQFGRRTERTSKHQMLRSLSDPLQRLCGIGRNRYCRDLIERIQYPPTRYRWLSLKRGMSPWRVDNSPGGSDSRVVQLHLSPAQSLYSKTNITWFTDVIPHECRDQFASDKSIACVYGVP